MNNLRLIDDGYPRMRKIMQGRKWIGRVVPHAEGGYVGLIGKDSARGASWVDAFRKVGAKSMGWSSPEALEAHNAAIRSRNKARRQVVRYAVDQALHGGNFKPFMDVIDKIGADAAGRAVLDTEDK